MFRTGHVGKPEGHADGCIYDFAVNRGTQAGRSGPAHKPGQSLHHRFLVRQSRTRLSIAASVVLLHASPPAIPAFSVPVPCSGYGDRQLLQHHSQREAIGHGTGAAGDAAAAAMPALFGIGHSRPILRHGQDMAGAALHTRTAGDAVPTMEAASGFATCGLVRPHA